MPKLLPKLSVDEYQDFTPVSSICSCKYGCLSVFPDSPWRKLPVHFLLLSCACKCVCVCVRVAVCPLMSFICAAFGAKL